MINHQDLLDAISTYLDAIYYCDVEKLDAVFHPASSLFDADNGEIFVDPIASFRADVASRPSPASVKQKRSDEIITIDWLSEMSATVKLRLHAHENIFADHLSFILGKDGWQIVAKVWHLEGTAEIRTE
ncbi:nuclear transport factor 2 family protein [Maritalea sp.]|uniref:nuclear transport factor 2 family protein n=1 Tax=Maritalea sp. TaxID=2003361 RepID=UPI003EF87391